MAEISVSAEVQRFTRSGVVLRHKYLLNLLPIETSLILINVRTQILKLVAVLEVSDDESNTTMHACRPWDRH